MANPWYDQIIVWISVEEGSDADDGRQDTLAEVGKVTNTPKQQERKRKRKKKSEKAKKLAKKSKKADSTCKELESHSEIEVQFWIES